MNDDHLMLEHSVIRIIGKNGGTAGTGFVIADGLAVTCAHVLQMQDFGPGDEIQVVFYHGESEVGAKVLEKGWSDKDNADVAFLRLYQIPDRIAPARLGPSRQSINHPSKTIGYPDLTGEGKATIWADTIGGVTDDNAYPQLFVQSTMMKEGFSGAPVLDLETGRVVGMVRFGYNRQHGIVVLCVTSETIQQFLFDVNPHHIPGLKDLPRPGVLPNPAPLPPGSRMDLPRNHLFTGREEDLHALATDLLYSTSGNTVALTQPVAAAGMGGIGKTQLAVEFCYRYGQFCEGLHWINAANPDAIGAEIAECGLQMGLQPWSDKLPEQVEATLRELAKSKRRIVVLDNLEEPSTLVEWLPKLQNVHVLATTRRVEWPPELGLRVQRLERFPRTESLRLLRKLCDRLEQEPDEILGEMAEVLCDLPLAVDLAGRYMNERKRLLVKQYINNLKEAGVLSDYAMSDEGTNAATRHLMNLEATFEVSWKELDAPEGTRKQKEMYLAQLAFLCAGYCAPTVIIPINVLHKAVKKAANLEVKDRNFEAVYERALDHVCTLGLLEQVEGGMTIHPLLAEFARRKDVTTSANKTILSIIAEAIEDISDEALETELPYVYYPLRPHLESVAAYCEIKGLANSGRLLNNIGQQLHGLGDYRGAKVLLIRALRSCELYFGDTSLEVSIASNNLGIVLRLLGDFAEAKAHIERALAIKEQVYGKEHPEVAITVSNLGHVLHDLGDLAGAKAYYEWALSIGERIYGTEHPNVAKFISNLGSVLQSQGDLTGAKTLFERALSINERVNGKEHPNVAHEVWWLGVISQAEDDLSSAKTCYERALAIYIKFLPEGHPTITSVRSYLVSVEAQLRGKG